VPFEARPGGATQAGTFSAWIVIFSLRERLACVIFHLI
jgi:hypothetical protein